MTTPRRIAIFGATGSIGRSAADVIEACADDLAVAFLAAARRAPELLALARRLGAPKIVLADEEAAEAVAEEAEAAGVEVVSGEDALLRAAAEGEYDLALNAVVGSAGARLTLAALDAGRDVALANKESLVVAGAWIRKRLDRPGAPRLVPVDSEHAAARSLLSGRDVAAVRKLYLTASGGPFRDRDPKTFDTITPEEALAHPTWEMGPRITIDSATLFNKGLEVIEAMHLFGLPLEKIDVVVHPQSKVHAVVETTSGSCLAEIAPPDMRIPIRSALLEGLPAASRTNGLPPPLSLADLTLTFEAPNRAAFPCLDLAYEAARRGGAAPAVANAADEVAVEAFLAGAIRFSDVPRVIEEALAAEGARGAESFDEVEEADRAAREAARKTVARLR